MKPSLLKQEIKIMIECGRPFYITSAPGCGKSQIVAQVANDLKMRLLDIRALLFDPVDFGLPYIENGMMHRAIPAMFPGPKDPPTFILLDELGAAPALTQNSLLQLMLDRRLAEFILADQHAIGAAGNRQTDRAGSSRLSTALAFRLWQVALDVDLQDWLTHALKNNFAMETIAFIRFRPKLLWQFDPKSKSDAQPNPRGWEFVSQVTPHLNPETEHEVINGFVGEGPATEYIAFLRIYRQLPDPDAVIMNPEKADIPTEPSALWALTGALAERSSESNFGQVLKYAARLRKEAPLSGGSEFSMAMVESATTRNKKLTKTQHYVKWSIDNQDLLV